MTAFNLRLLPLHRVFWLTPAFGLWLAAAWPAGAQQVQLRSSPRLQENLSPEESSHGAAHVRGERITVRPDTDLVLEGKAEFRRPGLTIGADRVEFDQTGDKVSAQGHVRVNRNGTVFQGPRVELQVDSMSGRFEAPVYRLATGGHGDAQSVEFIDEERMAIHQARYTTCRATPGPEWLPEWFLQAASIRTDTVDDRGEAEDVQMHFKGLSTPTFPGISFGLSSQRQSGLLAPIIGVDSISGVDVQQPYYWNIAPNRDATLTTRLMSRRGAAVEGDFRYLEEDYRGQARLNWMPTDSLRQTQRWGLSTQHTGMIDAGTTTPLGVNLSINRVSDDNYWRDFPRTGTGSNIALTQRLLPSNGTLSWSQDQLAMQLRVQQWQTLQDVSSGSYIKPPYDKAPQLTMRYANLPSQGLDWSVTADTTRFVADYSRLPLDMRSTLANGDRSYVQTQLSHTWSRPWGFITPKVQLHATHYQMQTPLTDGNSTVNRVLPTFSLDSGLTFERDTRWFGRDLSQTLEPRVFYVRTPYREQSALPLYDTGLADFSLATIYSENPYVGQDRIIDNDALTLGVNTRFFDSNSGAELLRLGVAQRIRFSDQRVTLSPSMAGDRQGLSDLLLGASTRWTERLSVDGALQLNADTHEVRRSTLQTRYSPGPYRLLNAAYRLNRGVAGVSDTSELLDLGWQWPLSDLRWGARPDDSAVRTGGQGLGADRWYGVGRMNYSLQDRRFVDTLIGFEYDAGCWLGRIVFERLQSTVTTATTRLMFQLELVGFGRVGVSPLDTLRNNIPRYQFLRETQSTPSRFLQYE